MISRFADGLVSWEDKGLLKTEPPSQPSPSFIPETCLLLINGAILNSEFTNYKQKNKLEK